MRQASPPRGRAGSIGLAVSVATALVVAACGSSAPSPSTAASDNPASAGTPSGSIRFLNWATSDENVKPWIEDSIKQFEQQNQGIAVESETVAVSDHLNQLVTRCSAGDCPDIAQVQENDISVLAAANLLAPVGGYDDAFLGSIPKGTASLVSVGGTMYGVPWTASPIALWYNKKLMADAGLDPAKPPTTIDEMMSMIRTVRAKSSDVIGLGIDTTLRDIGIDGEWPFMHAFGAEPIKDGKANANTAEMKAFLQWIRDLVAKGDTLPGKKFGEFRQPAAQGKVLFMEDGPYMKGLVQGLNTSLTDELFYDTWGVTAIPGGSGNGPSAGSSDHQFAIFASSANKAAAFAFAKFMAADPFAVKTYTAQLGVLPPVGGLESQVPALNNPASTEFQKIAALAIVPPYGPHYEDTVLPLMSNVQRAYSTQDPIDTIVADMQAGLEKVYGQ